MFIQQFYLQCLAHASYLIGDERSGTAAVIDPRRDITPYLEEAEARGVRIAHVFLTHFHADFIAGHLELRDRTGAAIYLGAAASAEYPFRPMRDGDAIEFGGVRLQVLETPGHTPESISVLAFDLDAERTLPQAVLTGDTLFVGDVGRPDLRAALGWSADTLGEMLYDSLRTKLLTLPDSTLVYPAHGAGSLCGKSLSKETVSTIGEQRRVNHALQPMSRQAFLSFVTADQPDAPPYFTYDAVLNSKERPTLDTILARELNPLTLTEALALTEGGAEVLDVRDPTAFAKGHLKGSINVGLAGQFATWSGTVLSGTTALVIIAEPGREEETATRLGRIGFDRVGGYLRDGIEALEDRPDLLAATDRVGPLDLMNMLVDQGAPVILDVRSEQEWKEKRISGSLNVPLSRLQAQLKDLPRDRAIVVHCAGGYRSSIASSVLLRNGIDRLSELVGGLAAWEAAGLPVVSGPATDAALS